MNVSIVLPEDIDVIWKHIEEYMRGAAKYTNGRYTVEDIYNSITGERFQQLWVAFTDEKIYGAVITEIMEYPQMKVLVMHFTGGIELPRWKDDMLKLLQLFARDNGCKVIESIGRAGWKKVFKEDGYKSNTMFYELPV